MTVINRSSRDTRGKLTPRPSAVFPSLTNAPPPPEPEQLQALVDTYGLRWADISRRMEGRTDQQCMGRWRRHLDPSVSRKQWSTKEDRALAELRVRHGANWSAIAKTMKNRTAQQCRARWFQAHFTGHRYLDDHGNLLSPRSADKAEREVEAAKAAAAAAGKTLRPNGVKAANNNNLNNILNNIKPAEVDSASASPDRKKRRRDSSGSSQDGKLQRRNSEHLRRDGSGRFIPREDSLPHNFVTPPPTTPGVDDSVGLDVSTVPPPIRVKPAGLHRDPSLGLGRQVSLPPDIATLLRGEAPDTGRAAEPLAQFNSGDWGALLTGELGSVTAVLDQLGEAEMLGGRESIGKLESFGSIQMLTRQRSGNVLTRMGSCNDSFAQLITPELVK